MSKTLALTEQLIALDSVTPEDKGCQNTLINLLKPLGFHCETIQSGEVTNLWARRGTTQPLVVFAGHTDVVPTGPVTQWQSEPFAPTHRDGKLFGRGAADMKTSIAAFVVATEEFVAAHPDHKGSIGFYESDLFETVGQTAQLAALNIVMLFFGQRLAKDYAGAASLAPYFIVSVGAIVLMSL